MAFRLVGGGFLGACRRTLVCLAVACASALFLVPTNAAASSLALPALVGGSPLSGDMFVHQAAIAPAACTVPGSPSPAAATGGQNDAEVSWSAAPENGTPVSGYIVTAYDGTKPENAVGTESGATSATVTGLVAGITYSFEVAAQSACGAGPSVTANTVTPTGALSTYVSSVLGDGPSVYYQLSDLGGPFAADSSGHGLVGFYNYDVVFGGHDVLGDTENPLVSDPVNTSVAFLPGDCCNYASGMVDPSATGLPGAGQPVTAEMWFKASGTDTYLMDLWGDLNVSIPVQSAVTLLVNGLAFTTPYQVTDGAWHMLDAVDDGSQLTVYLDGLAIGSQSVGATGGASSLEVGRRGRGPLSQVAIYPKALTAAQIANHFTASGDTRPTQPATVSASAGANQMSVSWSASTAMVPAGEAQLTSYQVQAVKLDGAVADAVDVPASSTSATLSGLPAGVEYKARVVAYNGFGSGSEQQSPPVTPTGALSTYASSVLGDGPSVYYQLSDLGGPFAADSSGHGLVGFYNYDVVFGGHDVLGDTENPLVSDPVNTSVAFLPGDCCNYASGMVDPSATGLPGAGQPVTAEMWFKASGTDTYLMDLWGDLNVSIPVQSAVTLLVNGLAFTTPYQVTDGAWHMLDAVDDGSQLTVYLDGLAIGSQSVGATGGASSLEVGRRGRGPLSQVAIYPKALTAAQIANHFAASGAPSAGPPAGMSELFGDVVFGGAGAAEGARIQVCPTSGAPCITDPQATDSYGWYRMLVPTGTYTVTIFPPAGSPDGSRTIGPLSLPPAPLDLNVTFSPPGGLPEGASLSSPGRGTQEKVVPGLNWGEPSTYSVPGCKNGFGALDVQGTNSSTGQPEDVPTELVETPSGSGTYVAQIPPVAPMHGSANFSPLIACPEHSALVPNGGTSAGGTQVLLTGSGFTGATAVSFGSQAAKSFEVLDDHLIVAVSPAGTGDDEISVTASDAHEISVGDFSYFGVTSLDTTSGTAEGGTSVAIHGYGFNNVQSVVFGIMPAQSYTVVSPTEVDAVAPPGIGTVDVQVINGVSPSDTAASDMFVYQNGPVGSSSVNEGTGPAAIQTLAAEITPLCSADPVHQALCATARWINRHLR